MVDPRAARQAPRSARGGDSTRTTQQSHENGSHPSDREATGARCWELRGAFACRRRSGVFRRMSGRCG
eukprot:8664458-Pyramimonas_sp.AAC.1